MRLSHSVNNEFVLTILYIQLGNRHASSFGFLWCVLNEVLNEANKSLASTSNNIEDGA